MASQNSDILLPFFLWRENYSQNTTKSEVDTVNTVVVQSQSHVWLFMTSLTIAHQLTLSTLSWGLFRFMSIETVMLHNHLNPCCPIMLLASVFLRTRVFSNELALHIRRLKYYFQYCQEYYIINIASLHCSISSTSFCWVYH